MRRLILIFSCIFLFMQNCAFSQIGKGIFIYAPQYASSQLVDIGFPSNGETPENHVSRVLSSMGTKWVAVRANHLTSAFITACHRAGIDIKVYAYQKLKGTVAEEVTEVIRIHALNPDGIIMMPSDCWICDVSNASAYTQAVDGPDNNWNWRIFYCPPAIRLQSGAGPFTTRPGRDSHCDSSLDPGVVIPCAVNAEADFPHGQFANIPNVIIMPRVYWRSVGRNPHPAGFVVRILNEWNGLPMVPIGQKEGATGANGTFAAFVGTARTHINSHGIIGCGQWALDHVTDAADLAEYAGTSWP